MANELGVYKAITKVTAAMASEGIGKTRKNQQQGYAFRGIDDIYNALSRMLADSNLCIIPRILHRTCEERTTRGGAPLFYVVVEAEYSLVSAEDGSHHIARVFGEAMDSADKATNKAMSAAYKYMAFQTFAIPTEGDNDADSTTPQITPTAGTWEALDDDERVFLEGIAGEVIALLDGGDVPGACNLIDNKNLDADEKTALWTRFDSKQRSAMKKHLATPAPYNYDAALDSMREAKSEAQLKSAYVPAFKRAKTDNDAAMQDVLTKVKDECKTAIIGSISGDPSEGDLDIPALGERTVI